MRLLLVEDHRDIAANIGDYLGAAGHEVAFAYDGAAGLHRAEREPFDVIVLDRMLPQLDGVELCWRLRRTGKTVPVLMLTALDTLPDKIAGFGAGADDYLVKPFELAELLLRLEALTRRGNPLPARQLHLGTLVYDLQTLQASRAGKALALNPTLRIILEVLLRQAPDVVSRAELKQALWGDAPPGDEVLRAHMHALRVALDRSFGQPMLRTVHGAGYRLVDPSEP